MLKMLFQFWWFSHCVCSAKRTDEQVKPRRIDTLFGFIYCENRGVPANRLREISAEVIGVELEGEERRGG